MEAHHLKEVMHTELVCLHLYWSVLGLNAFVEGRRRAERRAMSSPKGLGIMGTSDVSWMGLVV